MSLTAPLPLDDAPPPIGHNKPPTAFDEKRADIEQRVAAFLKGGDVWEKRPAFDKDLAERANDFLAGLRKLIGEADKARLAETKPHRDATSAINQWWTALTDKAEKVIGLVEPKLDAYKRALQRKADEERRAAEQRQREAAEAARRAALEAAQARTASAQIEAEALAQALAQQAKDAAQDLRAASAPVMVGSATGLANRSGIRKERKPIIKNLTLAYAFYRDRPEVAALILQLAAADLRHAPTVRSEKQVPVIPGIEFIEVES